MERTGLTLPPLILHPEGESLSLPKRFVRSTVLYGKLGLTALAFASASLVLYSFSVSHPVIAGWLTTIFAFAALFLICLGFMLFRSITPASGSVLGNIYFYLSVLTMYGTASPSAKRKALERIFLQKGMSRQDARFSTPKDPLTRIV